MAPWVRWRQAWKQRSDDAVLRKRSIPDALWQATLQRYPFITMRTGDELLRLRRMSTLFLANKEFSGANGMQVSDEVAVAVAMQACLPILNLGLACYGGFKGIVMHADEVVAQRVEIDDDGVVHEYAEPLSGEAMQGGPVMLSWRDVADAGETAAWGYNVVIHEFAHVLDMSCQGSHAQLATPELRLLHQQWLRGLKQEFQIFVDAVGREAHTVLDPYGAQSLQEFFAVASEAFFVQPLELQHTQNGLYQLMRDCYLQDPAACMCWQNAHKKRSLPAPFFLSCYK